MSEQNRTLARRWFDEVWMQRSPDAVRNLMAPECLGHHEGHVTRGPADFEAFRAQILQIIPDIAIHVEDVVADENHAVARWTFHGKLGGEQPIEFSGMTWFTIKNGQIVEGWDRWNQTAFQQMVTAYTAARA